MMQKKKLLIFHPYLAPYRIDLYNALTKVFDVMVLLTGSKKELATLGYDLQAVNRQAAFSYQYYSKGLFVGRHLISSIYYKVIKKFKPDILLAHELGINTLFAILLKSIFKHKIFVTIDDSLKMSLNYSKLREHLRKFVITHTDGLIVVHPDIKIFLAQKYGIKGCKYHYLPIIQDEKTLENKFCDALPQSQDILEKYNFLGKKVILFIGRLIEDKNPGLLLDVFAELYKNNTDLRLVFIGDGVLKNILKDTVTSNHLTDTVCFTGRLTGTDLYAWYNIGQIFVLPSLHEPFGAVVNEALVAGCKVIVSDSVGASCLINENNGIIFKTNDYHSLENALSQTITNILPLNKLCVRSSNMNESFSVHVSQFTEFVCSS